MMKLKHYHRLTIILLLVTPPLASDLSFHLPAVSIFAGCGAAGGLLCHHPMWPPFGCQLNLIFDGKKRRELKILNSVWTCIMWHGHFAALCQQFVLFYLKRVKNTLFKKKK